MQTVSERLITEMLCAAFCRYSNILLSNNMEECQLLDLMKNNTTSVSKSWHFHMRVQYIEHYSSDVGTSVERFILNTFIWVLKWTGHYASLRHRISNLIHWLLTTKAATTWKGLCYAYETLHNCINILVSVFFPSVLAVRLIWGRFLTRKLVC